MATSISVDASSLPGQLLGSPVADIPNLALTLFAVIVLPVIASFLLGRQITKLPVINPPKLFQLATQKESEFSRNGMAVVREGRERFPGKPFFIYSNFGPMTVLPAERAYELRNNPTLTFRTVFSTGLDSILPGFRHFHMANHPGEFIQKVIMNHLTKRLNTITFPLARETSFAVAKILGESTDWTEVPAYSAALDLVARMSSRVFLGPELCRDEEWLHITKSFTTEVLTSLFKLRIYPRLLRPLVYLSDPGCTTMRNMLARASCVVDSIVASRRKERQECHARGISTPVYNDAIQWAESEAAGVYYNPTDVQLGLSFAAIHTTSDLLTQTLIWLAQGPEAVEALRVEMLEVLPVSGWKKSSLYNLKLLDSAIKEAQRLKPSQQVTMMRKATADTELSDGVVIRKGQLVGVDNYPLVDPSRYENPDKFDIYRFRKMRDQPGGEHKAQLVSSIPEHMAFGNGKYSCPGRFFAANEVKLALCHLLLRYDWKLAPDAETEPVYLGTQPRTNPKATLLYRRRKEEIDLDSLDVDDLAVEEN
ncbi:hypothetical protein RB601_004247 [Gaeumannomyces tritici]